jgi:chemotaxis protein CheD
MRLMNVGIGEMAVSNASGDLLKTYALGSCLGVIVLAPRLPAAGLLHIALPDSKINQELAQQKPGFFADTGIPGLLQTMAGLGCNRADLVIKLAGGANIADPHLTFEVGRRNLLAARKQLWRYRLGAIAEDVGGEGSRTVTVWVETGRVVIASPGKGEWEI